MNLTMRAVAQRYLDDVRAMERAHPLQLAAVDDRMRSDLRGVDAVFHDALLMNRLWVSMILSHSRKCWWQLQDPGATCICKPWNRPTRCACGKPLPHATACPFTTDPESV